MSVIFRLRYCLSYSAASYYVVKVDKQFFCACNFSDKPYEELVVLHRKDHTMNSEHRNGRVGTYVAGHQLRETVFRCDDLENKHALPLHASGTISEDRTAVEFIFDGLRESDRLVEQSHQPTLQIGDFSFVGDLLQCKIKIVSTNFDFAQSRYKSSILLKFYVPIINRSVLRSRLPSATYFVCGVSSINLFGNEGGSDEGCSEGRKASYRGLITIKPKIEAIQSAVFVLQRQDIEHELGMAKPILRRCPGEPEQQRDQEQQEGGEAPIHALVSGLKPHRLASETMLDHGVAA